MHYAKFDAALQLMEDTHFCHKHTWKIHVCWAVAAMLCLEDKDKHPGVRETLSVCLLINECFVMAPMNHDS